jgi:hypothetical protein
VAITVSAALRTVRSGGLVFAGASGGDPLGATGALAISPAA